MVNPDRISVTPIVNALLALADIQYRTGDTEGSEKTLDYGMAYLERQMELLRGRP